MLVTIRDFPDGLATRLKLIHRTTVASKAVLIACEDSIQLRQQVRTLEEQVKALELKNSVLSQTLSRARDAALFLVEKTSQPDLVDD